MVWCEAATETLPTHVISTRVAHDLAQTDAHALSLVWVVRVQASFEDRNDLRQNLLAQLLHDVTQSARSHLHEETIMTTSGVTIFDRTLAWRLS